jgi:hypothetical protein
MRTDLNLLDPKVISPLFAEQPELYEWKRMSPFDLTQELCTTSWELLTWLLLSDVEVPNRKWLLLTACYPTAWHVERCSHELLKTLVGTNDIVIRRLINAAHVWAAGGWHYPMTIPGMKLYMMDDWEIFVKGVVPNQVVNPALTSWVDWFNAGGMGR